MPDSQHTGMLLLAQAPADFGPWVGNAFYVVGLVTACVVLYQRLRPQQPRQTRIEGQPVIVKADAEYVSLQTHNDLSSRVDDLATEIRRAVDRLDGKRSTSVANLYNELESSIADLRKETKTDITGVQERINDVLSAVANLQGQMTAHFRQHPPR